MATKTKPKRSTKREIKLPEKLSDCLAVALGDLIQCERMTRKYAISMREWHSPNGKCSVCLAGAVMAQTLHLPADQHVEHPEGSVRWDDYTGRRLAAINRARVGQVHWALETIGAQGPESLTVPVVRNYDTDGATAFKSYLRSLIKELRKHGL